MTPKHLTRNHYKPLLLQGLEKGPVFMSLSPPTAGSGLLPPALLPVKLSQSPSPAHTEWIPLPSGAVPGTSTGAPRRTGGLHPEQFGDEDQGDIPGIEYSSAFQLVRSDREQHPLSPAPLLPSRQTLNFHLGAKTSTAQQRNQPGSFGTAHPNDGYRSNSPRTTLGDPACMEGQWRQGWERSLMSSPEEYCEKCIFTAS